MTDEFIGKKIGGYEIEARIGQGGMATVYRARQTSMNRTVALKILPRHFMRDDTYLQRFDREVKIIAQLEHRNIIPVFDYGEHEGQPYIALRYMPAGTVDDLLAKGPIDLPMILHIVEQIAPALDYAHAKNVLHRDLKPSNILLDDDGGAYITDFGIARIVGMEGQGTTITTQGVVGTPSYMSPEQAQGHPLDGRSDLYALGIMLFEMATGVRPFQNDTPYSIAVMQVTTPPPPPRHFNPALSPAVEKVILKALKKSPEERYQTAAELAEALRQAVEHPESVHDTQPRPIPAVHPLEVTQPASTSFMPYEPQSTVPSPPAPILPKPQPGFTPLPPGSQPRSQLGMPPVPGAHRMRRPRQGSIWVWMIVGGLIGCALLAGAVAGAIIAVDSFFADTPTLTPTRQQPAEATEDPGDTSGIAPLDATSAAARDQLIPATATSAISPVGVRPTVTLDPQALGDSTSIVYFAERDGNNDIYRFDLQTGEETRLTDDPATDSYPVASPDGRHIVFQSDRDGDFEIYVMNSDGSNLRRLTINTVLDRLPAWSPDGQWIVYSSDMRGDGKYDLYRVPAAGGQPEAVLSNGARNSHARYSPDGRYLVFTTGASDDAATWEIARLDLETGEVIFLTDNDVRDASPVFSPDGSQVVFITGNVTDNAIAIVPAEGSAAPRALYDDSGDIWGAYFSPDGAFITFNTQTSGASPIYIIRADGSDATPVAVQGGFYPSWIPGR